MKCPNCGTLIATPQQVWQERNIAKGLCRACGKRKPDGAYVNCQPCRVRINQNARHRRQRRAHG